MPRRPDPVAMTTRPKPHVWWQGATVWHHFNGYFDAHEERTLCGREVPRQRVTSAGNNVAYPSRCKQCERKRRRAASTAHRGDTTV